MDTKRYKVEFDANDFRQNRVFYTETEDEWQELVEEAWRSGATSVQVIDQHTNEQIYYDTDFDYPFFDGSDGASTIEISLDYFETYVSRMEASLKKQVDDVKKEILQEHQRQRGGMRFVQYTDDERIFLAEEVFPNFFRSSCFLSIYTLFENGLINRCRCVEKAQEQELSVEDISRAGGSIVQYRKYLEKVCGIDFSTIGDTGEKDKLWEKFLLYRGLRNCFAHTRGYLFAGKSDLRTYIDNPETPLRLEPYKGYFETSVYADRIILCDNFCEMVIGDIRRFFVMLDVQLPEKCRGLEHDFQSRFWR